MSNNPDFIGIAKLVDNKKAKEVIAAVATRVLHQISQQYDHRDFAEDVEIAVEEVCRELDGEEIKANFAKGLEFGVDMPDLLLLGTIWFAASIAKEYIVAFAKGMGEKTAAEVARHLHLGGKSVTEIDAEQIKRITEEAQKRFPQLATRYIEIKDSIIKEFKVEGDNIAAALHTVSREKK